MQSFDSFMNSHLCQFHLRREIAGHDGAPVTSSHTIDVATDDPFRTAKVIEKLFAGWEVDQWVSEIDVEFEDKFGGGR